MTTTESKKHPCPDCRACQGCSPTRCSLCRGEGAENAQRRFDGLSIGEQCALYDAVNRGEALEGDYRPETEAFPIIKPA